MLIDCPQVSKPDATLAMLAMVNGRGVETKKLATGVYEIGHFGSSRWPSGRALNDDGFEKWGSSGVCDNYEQVIAHHPEVNDPETKYVITLTPVIKADQSAYGGWRWHKWGEYIGVHTPQHEYLYNEDDTIQVVYCYHIYEMA